MSIIPLSIATVCYVITAYSNLKQRDYPHAFVWFSYALANCGLLWYEYDKTKT